MKYSIVIENFINGNLRDFKIGYGKIKAKLKFWDFVLEFYGKEIHNNARQFLIKRGF